MCSSFVIQPRVPFLGFRGRKPVHINSALKQQGHGFKFKLRKQSATNKTFSHHVQFFRTENTQTQKETQTRGFTRKKFDPQLPPRPEECIVLAVWFLWGSLCAWPLPFGPPWALLADAVPTAAPASCPALWSCPPSGEMRRDGPWNRREVRLGGAL